MDTYPIGKLIKGGRAFGATIEIPNIANRMMLQKLDAEGNGVNDATFALYPAGTAKEASQAKQTLYYLDETNESKIVLNEDGTARLLNSAERGTYTIDPGSGHIAVTIGGSTYGIAPQRGYDNRPIIKTTAPNAQIREQDGVLDLMGSGHIAVTIGGSTYGIAPQRGYDNRPIIKTTAPNAQIREQDGVLDLMGMPNGNFVLREIKAPAGYLINPAQIMVQVDDHGICINAGVEHDGVTVSMPNGNFVLREIKAPAGYLINPAQIMVQVDDHGICINAGVEHDGVTVSIGASMQAWNTTASPCPSVPVRWWDR